MGGNVVEKTACPSPTCNSSDGFVIYEEEGKYTGYCWVCKHYEANPYGDAQPSTNLRHKTNTMTAQVDRTSEVHAYKDADLSDRGILPSMATYYGIKADPGNTRHYYPYFSGSAFKGYKERIKLSKEFYSVGDTKKVDLFGQAQAQSAGSHRLIITEGECFPPETEVLTRKGWVSFQDYDGEAVLQVEESGASTFVLPRYTVEKRYEGGLIHYKSGSYESMTTPDHNLIRLDTNNNLVKMKAKETHYKHYKIPRVVSKVLSGVKLPVSDDMLRVMVMLSADFTFRKEGDIYGAFKKDRKVKRITELLDSIGISYNNRLDQRGYNSIYIRRGHGLPNICSKLFDHELVGCLSSHQMRVIVEEVVHWDGNTVPNRAQIEYSSKELDNVTFIQTLAHLSGYVSTIIPRSNNYGSWYKLSILLNKSTSSVQQGYTTKKYKGLVYCVGVPSGMILVRYKGSISVSGNCDCVAAFQMLWVHQQGTQYADRVPSVVSLPHGSAGAVTDLSDVMEFIDRYKEVVLCFDGDKAGEEAVREAMKILPIEKVKVAKFTEKDSNDMLLKGKEKEFVQEVLWNAKPWKPLSIVSVEDVYEQAIAMPKMGLAWPWPSLTKSTYGINPGMLYGVGAGVGIGKTTFWHKVVSHLINEHNQTPGLFMFEEPPGKTLKNLATHMYHKKFTRPDGTFAQADLCQAIDHLKGKTYICDHRHMVLGIKEAWPEVKQAIRHMILVEGCKQIILDPITALTAQMTSSEANEFLNGMMAELAGIAEVLGASIFYGAHLNAPKMGPPHEEGGRVMEAQFTGSRAMIKWSHYILGLERNKQAETEEERNTTQCRGLKDREFGNSCLFPIYYDSATGSFDEIPQKEYDYSTIASPNLRIPT